MNTAGSMQGARGPDRGGRTQDVLNRTADALMAGVEALAHACDELWKSFARRVSRSHAGAEELGSRCRRRRPRIPRVSVLLRSDSFRAPRHAPSERGVPRLKPAVVNITTTQEVKVARMPFFAVLRGSSRIAVRWARRVGSLLDPLGLGDDRDRQRDRQRDRVRSRDSENQLRMKRQSLGSGFIVDARGYAVTNAHVVTDAGKFVSDWPTIASSMRR